MKSLITATISITLAFSGFNAFAQAGAPGPHLLVYKTKKNYSNLVPVMLSDDKKTIVSYPDPRDIRAGGSSIQPTKLKNGYLIDNRGIGRNVAFLNISYRSYAKLKTVPSITKLYQMIKDKDPLTSLCDCGLKRSFEHPKDEINALIAGNKLKEKCETLK